MATITACDLCGSEVRFATINQREVAAIPPNVRMGDATCKVCGAKYRLRLTRTRDSRLSSVELKMLRAPAKE